MELLASFHANMGIMSEALQHACANKMGPGVVLPLHVHLLTVSLLLQFGAANSHAQGAQRLANTAKLRGGRAGC